MNRTGKLKSLFRSTLGAFSRFVFGIHRNAVSHQKANPIGDANMPSSMEIAFHRELAGESPSAYGARLDSIYRPSANDGFRVDYDKAFLVKTGFLPLPQGLVKIIELCEDASRPALNPLQLFATEASP